MTTIAEEFNSFNRGERYYDIGRKILKYSLLVLISAIVGAGVLSDDMLKTQCQEQLSRINKNGSCVWASFNKEGPRSGYFFENLQ